MLEGSHFGNWDCTDNVMRAVLTAPTMTLAVCCIAGRPQWYCQHVGLGEPIGYGARLTMNNDTLYQDQTNEFARAVYVALMGDPTLRMEPVAAVSNLRASANAGAVTLNWSASTDTVAGYLVYRSASARGPFARVSNGLISGASFDDPAALSGSSTYMVRAVALQSNPSGSYFNPSQGMFVTVNAGSGNTNGNPVAPVIAAGTYNGLFYELDQVRQNSAGSVSVTINTKGSYSGRLQLEKRRHSFSGKISDNAQAMNSLARSGQNPLALNLSFGTGEFADQMSGTVSDGTWTAQLAGDRAQFSSRTNPCPWAGNYTLVLPGVPGNPSLPAGSGYATARVTGNGQVTAAINLADNTKASQGATISKTGAWPLYASLYGGQGSLVSWITMADQPSEDLNGTLNWIKLPNSRSRFYPAGFSLSTVVTGSRYQPPVAPAHILDLDNGQLTFSDGNLASSFATPFAIGNANRVTGADGTGLKMSFTLSTGRFGGSVADPSTSRALPFSGVILQKSVSGAGFLLGTDQASSVELR
jgi:hypothetical protein